MLDYGGNCRVLLPAPYGVEGVGGGESDGHLGYSGDYTNDADCHDECVPRPLAALQTEGSDNYEGEDENFVLG